MAGELLIYAWASNTRKHEDVLLPALFCYRQYLELELKRVTSEINIYGGTGSVDFKKTHNLEVLWNDMEQVSKEVTGVLFREERDTFEQAKSCVKELNQLDPRGLGLRYPDVIRSFSFSPSQLVKVMRDIEAYLGGFLSWCTNGEA